MIKSFFAGLKRKKNIKKMFKHVSITGRVDFGSEPYLIKIGNNVTITDGVKFLTHDGGCRVLRNYFGEKEIDLIGTIELGNNVFVGSDSIILYNTKIGDNVIIGCNSVVTKDLPSNGVYAGSPARFICSIEEFKEKHQKEFLPTKTLGKKEKESFLKEHFRV